MRFTGSIDRYNLHSKRKDHGHLNQAERRLLVNLLARKGRSSKMGVVLELALDVDVAIDDENGIIIQVKRDIPEIAAPPRPHSELNSTIVFSILGCRPSNYLAHFE
jgi:hypothetical protein